MHIDMNAFFASVEQTANPFIANKPVAVGNPHYKNTALVAVSYEARARGVKNLSRGVEARAACPDLIIVPFDPLKYYAVNRQIVNILKQYTSSVEVYSIDEAFVDLTDVLDLHGKSAVEIAQEIKARIINEVGFKLRSSVGLAPNKLLAKVGSNWQKPDGLTEIFWDNRFEFIDKVPIQDIWGIGYRGGPKLRKLGINSTKQLREMSDHALREIVGSYYTRLRMIANGEHHEPVDPFRTAKPAKSMQHAHTMSKPTANREYLKTVIRKMSERLARRLRKHQQEARGVYLGLRPENMGAYGWGSLPNYGGFQPLALPSNHGKDIYDAACRALDSTNFQGHRMRLVSVGVSSLVSSQALRFDMFNQHENIAMDKAIDKINGTYGQFTVRTADILHQRAKESELQVERENMTFHPESVV